MDADTIEKYRKVKALIVRGATDGERKAAATVLAAMERKYPGIGVAAAFPASPAPDGAFGFPPPPGPAKPGASSGTGFRASGRAAPPVPPVPPVDPSKESFVDGVFEWLRSAAEGLREGMTLRDRVLDAVETTSVTNTRSLRITVTMPLTALDAIFDEFGDDKDAEIATILSTVVRDEFLCLLTSMDVEGGDE